MIYKAFVTNKTPFLPLLAMLFIGVASGFAQDKPKDPTPAASQKSPTITLEQKEKFEALQKQTLQIYIQMQEIQRRYENSMKADPQYADLSKKNDEITQQLTALSADIMKGVDPKKWNLNYDTVTLDPIKPEEGKKP